MDIDVYFRILDLTCIYDNILNIPQYRVSHTVARRLGAAALAFPETRHAGPPAGGAQPGRLPYISYLLRLLRDNPRRNLPVSLTNYHPEVKFGHLSGQIYHSFECVWWYYL